MVYAIITSLFDRHLQSNDEKHLHLPRSRSSGWKFEYFVSLYDIFRTEYGVGNTLYSAEIQTSLENKMKKV